MRRAMTLVELLVVIVIVVIVAAVLIPRIRPAIDDLKRREAAASLVVQLEAEQAAAVRVGRPCGLRLVSTPTGVLHASRLEAPPPYAGDTLDTVVGITEGPPLGFNVPGGPTQYVATIQPANCGSLGVSCGVGPGDTVRFNYRGPTYTLTSYDAGSFMFRTLDESGQRIPPPPSGPGVKLPFQIFRRPLPTISTGEQFPRGTCIDLAHSGEGRGGQFPPVRVLDIVFRPDGRVLYYLTAANGTTTKVAPQAALCLLVGHTEDAGTPAQLANLGNHWVAVRPLTGRCERFENQPSDASTPLATQLAAARGLLP